MKIVVFVAGALIGVAAFAATQRGARITLSTGESIVGELRGSYEAVRNGLFEPVDENARGAGLRLFSPQGASGFTFIARDTIADVTRGVALDLRRTDPRTELQRWREWRTRERATIAALRDARLALRAAQALAELPPPPPTLLERFPPTDGWKPELVDHLRWRALVLHLYPTPEQREWLANFDAWYVEYVEWLVQQTPRPIPFAA